MYSRLLVFSFLVASISQCFGQATGTITGSVTDRSGAVIPAASVIVTNQETNQVRQTTADDTGKFTLTFLPVGTYSVRVDKEGFGSSVRKDVLLQANTTVQTDAQLEVRSTTEQIQVTAEASLVQATSTTLVQVVDTRRVQDLPLNGRNVLNLMQINAGVSTEGATGQSNQIQNLGTAVTASINGSRGNGTNFLLDNGDNNDGYTNTALPFPNPDAVQEFSIQTSTFDAQYGRGVGGVVNVVTKSGTNRVHGSLFEYLRNYELNAANFFSGRDTVKRNQFGGSFGGPVVLPKLYNGKDRTFFFFAYQGTRASTATPGVVRTTPTEAMKRGDLSEWLLANGTGRVLDPLTRQPFPGNIIPTSRFDPVATKMLELMPPSTAANGYQVRLASPTTKSTEDQFIGRFDHQLTTKQRTSVRVFQFLQDSPWNYAPEHLYIVTAGQKAHSRNITANHTWMLSSNWVNDFNYTHNVTESNSNPPAELLSRSLEGYGARVKVLPDLPTLNATINGWSGFDIGQGFSQIQKNDQITDVVNYASGRHNLRFGIDFRHYRLDKTAPFSSGGQIGFSGQLFSDTGRNNAGNAFAEFLMGQAASWRQQSAWSELLTNNYPAFFAQDDWRITSRLTLNLGLRWDPRYDFKENLADKQATFIPGTRSTRFPNAPVGMQFLGDPGLEDAVVQPDNNNFAPRVGVAYQVGPNTVIRSAYGIFYDLAVGILNNRVGSGEPFVRLVTLNGPVRMADPYNGGPILDPTPFTPESSFTFTPYSTWALPSKNMPTSYLQNWNFIVEHQISDVLVRLGYVGSKGTHLLQAAEINPALYGPGANASNLNARRPYQPIAGLQLGTNSSWSNYHALQATIQKRWSHGFSILSNYTWSKSIDSLSSSTGNTHNTGPDPFNYNRNRGVSDFDLTHRLVMSGIYESPGLTNRSMIVRQLLGSWQNNFIFTAGTGLPTTVVSGVDNAFSGIGGQFADLTGQSWETESDRSKDEQILSWFNTGAFRTNAIGTIGNGGRNQLRDPGRWNIDYSLFKSFPLAESVSLQFRAEAFNVLNHANLGPANVTVNSPNFGRISSASSPRILQFALRLAF